MISKNCFKNFKNLLNSTLCDTVCSRYDCCSCFSVLNHSVQNINFFVGKSLSFSLRPKSYPYVQRNFPLVPLLLWFFCFGLMCSVLLAVMFILAIYFICFVFRFYVLSAKKALISSLPSKYLTSNSMIYPISSMVCLKIFFGLVNFSLLKILLCLTELKLYQQVFLLFSSLSCFWRFFWMQSVD